MADPLKLCLRGTGRWKHHCCGRTWLWRWGPVCLRTSKLHRVHLFTLPSELMLFLFELLTSWVHFLYVYLRLVEAQCVLVTKLTVTGALLESDQCGFLEGLSLVIMHRCVCSSKWKHCVAGTQGGCECVCLRTCAKEREKGRKRERWRKSEYVWVCDGSKIILWHFRRELCRVAGRQQ